MFKLMITMVVVSLIGILVVACGVPYEVAQPAPTPVREFKLELMDTVGLVDIYEIRSSRGGLCIMAVRLDRVELEC